MIQSIADFADLVEWPVAVINKILAQKGKYYYHKAEFKGIEGGVEKFRHFYPSIRELKELQSRIQLRLFAKILLPGHIQGCVKGRGNITNARAHLGNPYKFHTDLKSYFDFVSNRKVFEALMRLGFPADLSRLITNLTTHKGHLPQGAPTSPFLANIVGLQMDEDVLVLCKENNIIYTRYVDDLCLSSLSDFQLQSLEVIRIIQQNGFDIGHKKTTYKKGRLEITGANVCNQSLRPTRRQFKKYRDPVTPEHTKRGMEAYFKGLK